MLSGERLSPVSDKRHVVHLEYKAMAGTLFSYCEQTEYLMQLLDQLTRGAGKHELVSGV